MKFSFSTPQLHRLISRAAGPNGLPARCDMRHRTAGFFLAVVAAGALSGCSNTPDTEGERQASSEPALTRDASTSGNNTISDSGSDAGTNWQEALTRWWEAASQEGKQGTPQPTPQPTPAREVTAVRVDIATVAANHPLWKLANALENQLLRAAPLEQINETIPQPQFSPRSIPAPSFDVTFPRAGEAATVLASGADAFAGDDIDGFSAPRQVAVADDLQELQAEARTGQVEPITRFLQMATLRHLQKERDYAEILQTELEEAVAAAERSPLPPLPPVLPPPEVQLLMTNLRLKLSTAIFSTEDERAAARARLDALTEEWGDVLRQQEEARYRELQRLRVAVPERIRQEGLVRVRRELDVLGRARTAARAAVLADHVERVRQDFGSDEARLGIVLPALVPPATATTQTLTARGGAAVVSSGIPPVENLAFTRTNVGGVTSLPSLAAVSPQPFGTLPSTARMRIRDLRGQAWTESIKQIQLVTRRMGWHWLPPEQAERTQNGLAPPNRTSDVLRILAGND